MRMTSRRFQLGAHRFIFCALCYAGCSSQADTPPPGIDMAGLMCPLPTVLRNGNCTIEADVVLTEPIFMPSGASLDCQDRRLRASSLGTAATTASGDGYVPSAPEVAIVIQGDGVTIKRCIIDGPNTGIIVVGGRESIIINNTIRAGQFGIRILGADDSMIADNNIVYALNGRGKGIWVQHDTDRNKILRNHVESAPTALMNAFVPLLPGSNRFHNTRLDGIRFERWGVRDGNWFGLTLLNMVLNGQLQQFAVRDYDPNMERPEQWGEDNIVEDNIVKPGPSVGTFAISVGGGHKGVQIRGNTIHGGGVHFSGPYHEDYTLAGTCSGDKNRLCIADADCLIPAIDGQSGKGTCSPTISNLTQGVRSGMIAGNYVYGPFAGTPPFFASAISTYLNSEQAVIEENTVVGTPAAVFLYGKGPLETARVTRNVLASNAVGLLLREVDPMNQTTNSVFSATFKLNDVIGSTTRAVDVSGAYAISTDLPKNYWGRTCAGGAFTAGVDSPSASITASSVYGVPVARTADASLPAVCP